MAPAQPETRASSPSRSLAIFLCLIPTVYCLAIMGYALLNFSEYGADVPHFLRYIAAPALIAGAFIAGALFLAPRKGANLGLTASAVLFALLFVEFVLNARLVIAMFSLASVLGAGAADGDHAARGRAGIPPMFTAKQIANAIEPEHLDEALLGGVPNQEVLQCVYQGKPLFYTADRLGFNNDNSVYDAPIDVMMVGDSFVEGHCLPRPETFVGQMRDLRSHTASIGMRGGGPLYELALIGRYGKAFRPKYVVMAFFEGNDWHNLTRESASPWLQEALTPGVDFGPVEPSPQQVERAGKAIDNLWGQKVSSRDVLTKSEFLRNIVALNELWGGLGLDYPKITYDQPIYGDILGRAKSLTESWGGKFILVYIPQGNRYGGLFDKSFVFDGQRNDVLDAAKAHGVDVVDLSETFGENDDPQALFAPDGHFSAAGATIAARKVEERISALERSHQPGAVAR